MVRKRREEEGGEDECDRDERGDAGKGGPIVVDAGGRRSGARRGTWLLLPVCCCMSGSVRMGPLLRPPQWVVVARLSLGLCVLCAGGLVREFAAPPAFVRRSGDSSGGGCRIHSWFIVRVGYVVVSYASPGQVSFCIFFCLLSLLSSLSSSSSLLLPGTIRVSVAVCTVIPPTIHSHPCSMYYLHTAP